MREYKKVSERDVPGSPVQEMQVRSLLGGLRPHVLHRAARKKKKEKKEDNVQMKTTDEELPSHVLSCFLPPEMITVHSQFYFSRVARTLSRGLANETAAEPRCFWTTACVLGRVCPRTGGRQMARWV